MPQNTTVEIGCVCVWGGRERDYFFRFGNCSKAADTGTAQHRGNMMDECYKSTGRYKRKTARTDTLDCLLLVLTSYHAHHILYASYPIPLGYQIFPYRSNPDRRPSIILRFSLPIRVGRYLHTYLYKYTVYNRCPSNLLIFPPPLPEPDVLYSG